MCNNATFQDKEGYNSRLKGSGWAKVKGCPTMTKAMIMAIVATIQ